MFPLLLNKDSVKPVPIEINFSCQFSRPKFPHTVFEVVKQKRNHKKEIMKQEESWKVRAQPSLWQVKRRQAVKTIGVVPCLHFPALGPLSTGNN